LMVLYDSMLSLLRSASAKATTIQMQYRSAEG
jgi:hypothetical protein